jgi:predicted transcriptional regulator YdeE
MEKYILGKSIKVFYVAAKSFPDGILTAHKKIHALVEATGERKFFGISYMDKERKIIYKAAVEEAFEGEAEKLGCETFIIPEGNYISKTLKSWMKDETIVAKTFQELLLHPRIDKNGFCLEIYSNETDMVCLVKILEDD